MKSSTKAQMQSKVFIYLFVGIVIVLLLVFAFVSIKKSRDRATELEQKKLEQEIDATMQEVEYGSVERKKLNIPPGTKEICFADITKRSEILKSPILLADKYKIMKNILESGEKKNIFFLTQKEPYITTIYQPGICFDHYPYFACFKPTANMLDIYIEGKGTCALIVMEYRICQEMSYRTDGKTVDGDTSFGSIYAKLTFKDGTEIISPSPPPTEICIEAVSHIGAEGLISEVYNVTPHLTVHPDSENITVDLKYEDYLLPEGADPGQHIKLKKSTSPWVPFESYTVDPDYKRVSGITKDLALVAVYGAEKPTAAIKNSDDCSGDIIPEGGELIVAKGEETDLCSASTDPDGDINHYKWDFGDDTTIEEGGADTHKTRTHVYAEFGSYNLTLTVTDQLGKTDSVTITVLVVSGVSEKDIPDGTIIMISNPIDWRIALQLVPAAMWKDMSGDHIVPYLVYHKKESETSFTFSNFKITGATGLLKTYYNNLYSDNTNVQSNDMVIDLFTDDPDLSGKNSINTMALEDAASIEANYFKYWTKYEDIVVVDYYNVDVALKASLFAAFINAPIIFVDEGNIEDYGPALDSNLDLKHAYIIGTVDAETLAFIKSKTKTEPTTYTSDNLENTGQDPRIPPKYKRLKSTIALTS